MNELKLSAAVADDWEDWEDESFQPKLETATNGQTKGQAALAVAKEPDDTKFAGEDEEDEAPPSWEKSIPKPQQVCCRHAAATRSSLPYTLLCPVQIMQRA